MNIFVSFAKKCKGSSVCRAEGVTITEMDIIKMAKRRIMKKRDFDKKNNYLINGHIYSITVSKQPIRQKQN